MSFVLLLILIPLRSLLAKAYNLGLFSLGHFGLDSKFSKYSYASFPSQI